MTVASRRSRQGRRPQKGKSRKRGSHWHTQDDSPIIRRYVDGPQLPDVGSGADPTAGAPRPLRRRGRTNRGDSL